HEELPLTLSLYRSLFATPRVLATSSDTEEQLLDARFGSSLLPARRLRLGAPCVPAHGNAAEVSRPDMESLLASYRDFVPTTCLEDLISGNYVLLLGRQSPSKNTPQAIAI